VGSHLLSNSLVTGVFIFSLFSFDGMAGSGETANSSCASFWEEVSLSDLENNPTDYLVEWKELRNNCSAHDGYYDRQLGYIYLASRDFAKAETAFRNASNMNPEYLNDLSQLYMTQSQYVENREVEVDLLTKAMSILNEVVEVGNVNYSVYLNLGSIYFILEDYPDAILHLENSINLQQTSLAFSLLGKLYFNLDRYEEARKSIYIAFEMDKTVAEDESAMYVLAMSNVALKDYENAKITLSLLSKTRPDLIGTETYQAVFDSIVDGFRGK